MINKVSFHINHKSEKVKFDLYPHKIRLKFVGCSCLKDKYLYYNSIGRVLALHTGITFAKRTTGYFSDSAWTYS